MVFYTFEPDSLGHRTHWHQELHNSCTHWHQQECPVHPALLLCLRCHLGKWLRGDMGRADVRWRLQPCEAAPSGCTAGRGPGWFSQILMGACFSICGRFLADPDRNAAMANSKYCTMWEGVRAFSIMSCPHWFLIRCPFGIDSFHTSCRVGSSTLAGKHER